ncbi:MAG TPA: hypothetical protein VI306_00430 [Pyrinomonadaceae bacterium]
MSVLSFPRIYFNGFMEWDPCTFNNNDWQEFPTYDGANAALNWSYLATQGEQVPPGITPENFTTTFRPWAIKLQPDAVDTPPGARIPAEWNMFGTHGVSFVQYEDFTTKITSGALEYDNPVTSDPLIGGVVSLNGDNGSGPGRLVDSNPYSFWSSQIYFDQLSFGSGDCIISGPPSARMHSRWLNLNRIYTQDQELTQPAASVACCFQAGIEYGDITWPAASANSTLAAKLQEAASQSPAQGIMVRFTAYVNLYFKNGILNNIYAQPRSYEDLAAILAPAWDAWNNGGDTSKFFSQPCYSHIVGVVGVWDNGELATVPGGRYLAAANSVSPVGTPAVQSVRETVPEVFSLTKQILTHKTAGSMPPTLLGPLVANVDYTSQLISLDLNSTMPENGTPGEWPSDLTKTNFGPLSLGVVTNGAFTQIVEIDYSQYAAPPYTASAGIIDIPFPNSNTQQLLENGSLAIQVQGQTALLEQQYTAQTDTRTVYLDQNGQADFNITACLMGTPAPANVLIAKYDQNLALIPSSQTQYVNFTDGTQSTITVNGITTDVTVVVAGSNGIATAGIEAQSPGFPVLAFFPYSGDTLPQPPVSLLGAAGPLITYAFYTTVRVLPFDDAVPGQFVDLWNSSGNQTEAWNFIYNDILYVYDMLFSVMLEFVDLGSQQAVEQNLAGIWSLISEEAFAESTYAMPITRDLSAGKRLTLQLWIYLVANNYNVPNFNVNSIPAGWSPS